MGGSGVRYDAGEVSRGLVVNPATHISGWQRGRGRLAAPGPSARQRHSRLPAIIFAAYDFSFLVQDFL